MAKNTLYIITGAPGSGKTHYGRKLAAEIRAAFIDIDTSTETLIKASQRALNESEDDRDSPKFKERFREAIYSTQFAIAAENLAHTNVVITGPFTKEIRDQNWTSHLENQLGYPVSIIYTKCSLETTRARIAKRNNPRDTSKLENWEKYIEYYDQQPPLCPHTIVETE